MHPKGTVPLSKIHPGVAVHPSKMCGQKNDYIIVKTPDIFFMKKDFKTFVSSAGQLYDSIWYKHIL